MVGAAARGRCHGAAADVDSAEAFRARLKANAELSRDGRARLIEESARAMSGKVARETLWIDTETLLPRRFEFTYSMPGFGDAAFDLIFEK